MKKISSVFYVTLIILAGLTASKHGFSKDRHTLIRVGLERGVVYDFKQPVKQIFKVDSHNIMEIFDLPDFTNKKLIIGRKLGSAQFLMRAPSSEEFQSFVVRVLPDDTDLSEPDYALPVGASIKIEVKNPIASVSQSNVILSLSASPLEQNIMLAVGLKAGRTKVTLKTAGTEESFTYTVEVYVPSSEGNDMSIDDNEF